MRSWGRDLRKPLAPVSGEGGLCGERTVHHERFVSTFAGAGHQPHSFGGLCAGRPQGVWLHEQPPSPSPLSWLWRGYLAHGFLTLLTSQWKTGKTTLLAVLLARHVTGGLLAGQPLTAGRVAVVSEESLDLWEVRRSRLDFGQNVCLFSRPFPGRPSAA